MLKRLLLIVALSGPWAAAPGDTPTILVAGDSLSVAHHMRYEDGWVSLLQERLIGEGYPHRVINASIGGDTTASGRARLPKALIRYRPAIVIIELGGNDGLRALPLSEIRANLAKMIEMAKRSGARVLLLGIRLPSNYGRAYTETFHSVYAQLARAHRIPLVPFVLEGIADRPDLMQYDGIHPRAEAQPRILANVWPYLQPLLAK